MAHSRISVDPLVMGGAPCVRGSVPVSCVVAMVADGMTPREIRAQLPDISKRDVVAALVYHYGQLRERGGPLRARASRPLTRPGTVLVRAGVSVPNRRW
ncbi:DUF433 domain-containing protein [Hamadaea tsunoensis]|uniref:DUF433 domain-containing protein n=1 Tax=Hamadaea tsunoensis TaxID=53368 RepID=UPI0005555126|nr:DUF433 domain-containing protein [Hamadaea tsunoensis]